MADSLSTAVPPGRAVTELTSDDVHVLHRLCTTDGLNGDDPLVGRCRVSLFRLLAKGLVSTEWTFGLPTRWRVTGEGRNACAFLARPATSG